MKDKTQNKVDKDKPCVGIVQHEEVTLLKQDYDAMVEREETLRKKLAEHNEYFESLSCKDFNEFQDFMSTFMLTPHEEQTLIQQLKQQLADKDHEIENYQHELEVYKHNDNIYSSNIIKMNNNAKRNKIDFAVAELEELKRILYESHYQEINEKCYLEMEDFETVVNCRIKELEEK